MGRIPPPPDAMADLVKMLSYEIIIGLFFGTMLRLIMSVLENTGSVISLQMGLSNATILNPTLATQSPLTSALLSVSAVTLIFITGLDHLLFRSLMALYDAFPAGGSLMPGDMAQTIIQIMNRSFVIGIELAMPFLVIGLLMFIALGMMQKLMPQVQLFLITMPVQIWGGAILLSLTFAGILTIWLQYFNSSLDGFFGR